MVTINERTSMMLYGMIVLSMSLAASSNKEIFFEANNLQQHHHYAQASTLYESIKNPGWGVFYNNGLCYLHQLNDTKALYNFYKADTLNHANASIQNLISLAQKNLAINEHSVGAWSVVNAFLTLPFLVWQLIGLILCVLLCVQCVSRLVLPRILLAMGYTASALLLINLAVHYCSTQQISCFLLTDKQVYCVNHLDSDVTSTITKATRLIIVDTTPGWYKIRYNTIKGWITNIDTLLV